MHFPDAVSSSAVFVLTTLLLLLSTGCGTPNQENIRLRKLNQDLTDQVTNLTTENEAQRRTIAGLTERLPTISTLPAEELKKFWITTGVEIGKLSGGFDLDPAKPGDEALRLYLSPTDQTGSTIQSAGSFVVQAFDLAESGDTHLGEWAFDAQAAKSLWRSFLFESGFELTCPWQTVPKHPDVTVRVTFTDELTHISFHAEKVLTVNLPPVPATAPTTTPAR